MVIVRLSMFIGLRAGSERERDAGLYADVGWREGWLCAGRSWGWRLILWTVARRSVLASSLLVLLVLLEAKRVAIALSCFLVEDGRLGIGLTTMVGVGSELCRDTGRDSGFEDDGTGKTTNAGVVISTAGAGKKDRATSLNSDAQGARDLTSIWVIALIVL